MSCVLGSPCWEGGLLELCHTLQYRCLGTINGYSHNVYMYVTAKDKYCSEVLNDRAHSMRCSRRSPCHI